VLGETDAKGKCEYWGQCRKNKEDRTHGGVKVRINVDMGGGVKSG